MAVAEAVKIEFLNEVKALLGSYNFQEQDCINALVAVLCTKLAECKEPEIVIEAFGKIAEGTLAARYMCAMRYAAKNQ